MRQVAIIGLADASHPRGRVPHCETWGLPWDGYAPHYDRLFEMHDRALWDLRGPRYLAQNKKPCR